jgi:hypothetical protein
MNNHENPEQKPEVVELEGDELDNLASLSMCGGDCRIVTPDRPLFDGSSDE